MEMGMELVTTFLFPHLDDWCQCVLPQNNSQAVIDGTVSKLLQYIGGMARDCRHGNDA